MQKLTKKNIKKNWFDTQLHVAKKDSNSMLEKLVSIEMINGDDYNDESTDPSEWKTKSKNIT